MKTPGLVMKTHVLLASVILFMAHAASAQNSVSFLAPTDDESLLDPADAYILSILRDDRQLDVTLVSSALDMASTVAAVEQTDFVVVSETIGSGALGAELNGTETPIITTEPWAYDDHNWVIGTTANDIAPATVAGNAPGIMTLKIEDASHPIVADYLGASNGDDVPIYINPDDPLGGPIAGSVAYGRFGPSFPTHANPQIIASVADPMDPSNVGAAIFVIEPGDLDTMGNPIPGLRIGFFFSGLNFGDDMGTLTVGLSDEGLALFNGAIDYALGEALLLPGDVNGDGFTDINDYTIIRDNLHTVATERGDGDLNRDGIVDLLDFRRWKNDPNNTAVNPPSTTVPEPASVLLVLVAVVGYASPRRAVKHS